MTDHAQRIVAFILGFVVCLYSEGEVMDLVLALAVYGIGAYAVGRKKR